MFQALVSQALREGQLALTAVQFFTRLPVPARLAWSPALARDCVRYLPAVGLGVGAVAALVQALAVRAWPPAVAVLLSMAATLWLTGALHEDGLADTADGLGGGAKDRTKVLAIMQDSRVGSFGVIALFVVLLLKFQLLVGLPGEWFAAVSVAAHAASRCSALWVMARLPYLRDDGPSKSRPLGRQLSNGALCFSVVSALPALLVLGLAGVVAGLATAAVAFAATALLHRRLGGYVGDTLGATQQCAELAFLLGCEAVLHGLSHA